MGVPKSSVVQSGNLLRQGSDGSLVKQSADAILRLSPAWQGGLDGRLTRCRQMGDTLALVAIADVEFHQPPSLERVEVAPHR